MSSTETPRERGNRKPLGRRLVKWVVVLLTIVVLVRVADYVWYRTRIPVRFTSANWTGTWKTEQYFMSGRLLVHLPDPIPENEDFDAEALVYYPIYSLWQTGRFVKMEFAGHFSPATSTSSGASGKDIRHVPGKLSFKATVGDQVVDYVALMDDSSTRIIGSYVSRRPSDSGYFRIDNH